MSPTKHEKEPHRTYNDEPKCIGFREALEESRARREAKPAPWLARKFAVGLVFAIWLYAYYVYIGRFTFEMLRPHRNESALGSRAEGVVFTVLFNLLWLMTGWAYFAVILTSPGYAKHHATPGPRPEPSQNLTRPSWDSDTDEEHTIAGPPYHPSSHPQISPAPVTSSPTDPNSNRETRNTEPQAVSSSSPIRSTPSSPSRPSRIHEEPHGARPLDSLPKPKLPLPIHSKPQRSPTDTGTLTQQDTGGANPNANGSAHSQPPAPRHTRSTWSSRVPPQHGTLLPEYRYCTREGFVKPPRAHHCRSCGKCVLQYDHHCPWIGQCVGARNRKFFVVFLFWSSLLSTYLFTSLLALNVMAMNNSNVDVDPPQIVLVALAGFFTIFTVILFITQIHLILHNMTTVEHLNLQSLRERQNATLEKQYPIYAFRTKRRARKAWIQEWGRPGSEGNIWWMGSKRKNFESVFGRRKVFWLLPLGKGGNEGLDFPVNPRFDESGRWRPRTEWPRQLQELR